MDLAGYVPSPPERECTRRPLLFIHPSIPVLMSDESDVLPQDDMLDLEALVRSLDGDRAFAAELLHTFRTTFPEYLDALRDALDWGRAEAVRDSAHQLKGSLHAVRAEEPADVAEEMEYAAADGDLDAVRERMDRLTALLSELATEVDHILEAM